MGDRPTVTVTATATPAAAAAAHLGLRRRLSANSSSGAGGVARESGWGSLPLARRRRRRRPALPLTPPSPSPSPPAQRPPLPPPTRPRSGRHRLAHLLRERLQQRGAGAEAEVGAGAGPVVVRVEAESSCSSLDECFYLRPSEVLYSAPLRSALSLSSSSHCEESGPELPPPAPGPVSAPASATATAAPPPVPAPVPAPAPEPPAFAPDTARHPTRDGERQDEVEDTAVWVASGRAGAPPLRISLAHVRALAPREQARLPRSAVLAARLDALSDADPPYAAKYGFGPLRAAAWTPPRRVAAAHALALPPQQVPSYLRAAARPLSELRLFARPWWRRVGPSADVDVGADAAPHAGIRPRPRPRHRPRAPSAQPSSGSLPRSASDDPSATIVQVQETLGWDESSSSFLAPSSRSFDSAYERTNF